MLKLLWKRGMSILLLALLFACGQPAPAVTTAGTAEPRPTVTAEPTPTPEATAEPQASAAQQVETVASHGGPVRDHVSFVDHLRARGFAVDPIGNVEQPFLQAQGTILRISGGKLTQPAEVQSYDYNDTDFGGNGAGAAEADAQQVGPDGNPRTAIIEWVAPPHFFRKERAFVIYIGDDPAVLEVLTEALGPQFAGR